MAWTKEQEEAIYTKGCNIIVSAGAGSGKTAVLTARTMEILKRGIHINELLILTFTRAASMEMRERIRNHIKKEESLKSELELIDQAYITTFDSFALSVLKKYHYLLNIDKNIKITDISIIELQKKKIMNDVFSKFYEEKNVEFQNLVLDFCVKDDKELKDYFIKIASKIDGLPNRDEYLKNYLDNFFNESYFDKIGLEYETILLKKVEELKQQREELSHYVDSYMSKLNDKIGLLCEATTIEEISSHCFFDRLPNLPKDSPLEAKEEKEKLKSILDDIRNVISMYGTKEEARKNLQKTYTYTKLILCIMKEYLEKLHEYKIENAIYDFEDVALLAIQLVKNYKEVREEIKNNFKEIMIDEYQDTNNIQETFISYIANDNVYMVGDIKQSIYRFRNANPYIFKNKYDLYSQRKEGLKIDLVKNFRSRKEVLENINQIFNLIMDNAIGGAEYHESHQMVFGNTSYIEEGNTNYSYQMRILEYEVDEQYSKEEIEIFFIARDIQEKIKNNYQIFDKDKNILRTITYSDFVILMDRTSAFDLYKKVFEYLKIPLTLYKEDKLNNSDDINIIKNSVDFILKIKENSMDNSFKYDFVSLARSYLYRKSDQEIFETIRNLSYIDTDIYQDFKRISQKIDSSTISTLLEEIIKTTNIYEKLITVGNIKESMNRISKLIDIAKNLEEIGYDIYDFNQYLKELQEESYDMKYSPIYIEGNSVKIMTIHKSKGLEFPICYYSGLYKTFNIRDLKERFFYHPNYGIILPFIEDGITETVTKYLVKYHYLEDEVAEKIRLFYVALTRAKEQMILLTPKIEEKIILKEKNNTIDRTIRRNYNSFSSILNSIKGELLSYYETIDLDFLKLTKDYLYTKSKIDKLIVDKKETLKMDELLNSKEILIEKKHFSKEMNQIIHKDTFEKMELGLKVHELLEHMDFINPNYKDIDNPFLEKKIKYFLNSKLLKDKDKAIIYKEYEFIYENNHIEYHGIIDLMLEYVNRIDIVDYKLWNIKDKSYIRQLEGYKKYIERIHSKKVNVYLFSILKGTIEKVNLEQDIDIKI